jgi:hypothetical protein
MRPEDTSERIWIHYFRLLGAKTPAERTLMTAAMFDEAHETEAAWLRVNNPDATEKEILSSMAERRFGHDLAARMYRR